MGVTFPSGNAVPAIRKAWTVGRAIEEMRDHLTQMGVGYARTVSPEYAAGDAIVSGLINVALVNVDLDRGQQGVRQG